MIRGADICRRCVLPLPCDGGASDALTPCQLSAQPQARHGVEGQPHTLGLADLSGPAGGEPRMGQGFSLGQAVYQCDLWVTSLPLCGLGCWLGLVDLAHHPGC